MRSVAALIMSNFLVFLLVLSWLVLSTDDPKMQVLNLFHTFVPITLLIGALGLGRAISASRREGWTDRIEGLATLSFLALAWGHYGAMTAIRRAADAAGYKEAVQFDTSSYRLASGLILVTASLIVVRWLTRRQMGEWVWSAVAVGWAAVVILAGGYLQLALVWVYLKLTP